MTERADLSVLADSFTNFALGCRRRSPLYATLALRIAADDELLALLLDAPETQRAPTLLLAAMHDIVLRGDAPDLAAHYPSVTPSPVAGDPFPSFRSAAIAHALVLRAMLAARHTQTNEIGRCALVLPALGMLAADHDALVLVDVGSSAGLNQLLTRYRYHYVTEPAVTEPTVTEPPATITLGPPSTVELRCGRRGRVPLPAAMPPIVATSGIDAQPVDVRDDVAMRWLEACVWPDQPERLARLRAAIAIARDHPPRVDRADAVEGLPTVLAGADRLGHPVVLNTWVLSYLTVEQRIAYVGALDAFGADHDLSWVLVESPAQTVGLPIPTSYEPEHVSVLSVVTWRRGRRVVRRLATCHPHGFWIHWEQ